MNVSGHSSDAADLDERNKRLVIAYFDDLLNRKDLTAIDRNMAEDFLDHNGPDGKSVNRAEHRAMVAAMQSLMPDLRVEVKDVIATGGKVVARNLWSGVIAKTNQHVRFGGFVLLRIADDKIVERWATVVPLHGFIVR